MSTSTTDLLEAIKVGSIPKVIEIAVSGVDLDEVDEHGYSPLHYAVKYGKLYIARILLTLGADPDTYSEKASSPLHLAVKVQNIDMVKLLLEYCAHVNIYEERQELLTPINHAVRAENIEIVKLLIEHNADINNTTPIIDAINKKNVDIIRLLLASGAFLEYGYSFYDYPLHCAVKTGDPEVVKELLLAGAETMVRDIERMTPLHIAVALGYTDIVKLLLEFGAETDVKDNCGYTPLMYSIDRENAELVDILLKYWADTTMSSISNVKNLNTLEGLIIAKLLIANILVRSGKLNDSYELLSNTLLKKYRETCESEITKIKSKWSDSEKICVPDIFVNLDEKIVSKYLKRTEIHNLIIYKHLIESLKENGILEKVNENVKTSENKPMKYEISWIELPFRARNLLYRLYNFKSIMEKRIKNICCKM
ncbi:SWPV1-204 [Shearwaterpox virus]|uniref:SWPV1-204 n=1 Tax=Shearwaterpox virus TaxID=1974596 RepID=A0A1V0S828_CNPV|nr:SWPV1-204 [Shearwaterpox virus]